MALDSFFRFEVLLNRRRITNPNCKHSIKVSLAATKFIELMIWTPVHCAVRSNTSKLVQNNKERTFFMTCGRKLPVLAIETDFYLPSHEPGWVCFGSPLFKSRTLKYFQKNYTMNSLQFTILEQKIGVDCVLLWEGVGTGYVPTGENIIGKRADRNSSNRLTMDVSRCLCWTKKGVDRTPIE